jgi:hypothetical protein
MVEDVFSVGVGGEEGGPDEEEADVIGSLEAGVEAGGEYTEEVGCDGSNEVISATVLEDVVVDA